MLFRSMLGVPRLRQLIPLPGLPSSGRPFGLSRLFSGLLSLDRQQHFLLACGSLSGSLALRSGLTGDALFQRIHEVYHVLALGPGLWTNSFTLALGVDEFGQSLFVVVFEPLRFKVGGFA
jgi:hypothetical protein